MACAAMTTRARHVLTVILALALVVILWRQVFVMTGILWWNAPHDKAVVARPAAPEIPPPDTGWVAPAAYLHTHPVWRP